MRMLINNQVSHYLVLTISAGLLFCFGSRCFANPRKTHMQYHAMNPGYNLIKNRYHPTTFTFTHDPHDLEAAGDAPVQYSFQETDTQEGEVMNHGSEGDYHPPTSNSLHSQTENTYNHEIEGDYNSQMNGYQMIHHPAYPYPAPGYHYPPPPEAQHPPHHLVPHKSKQVTAPYTFYYIGRHLWYIPLYFSIYFIVYVGLLVLKSIARHKILFPQQLQEAASMRDNHVLRSISKSKQRYYYM